MAPFAFAARQLARLEFVIENNDQTQVQSILEEYGIPPVYATSMGQLILLAEIERIATNKASSSSIDFSSVCKRDKDLRCQVGHVLSYLKSRNNGGEIDSSEGDAYCAFRRNAKATVLIVDKSGLVETEKPNEKGKILIKGVAARHALDLSKFARDVASRDLPLCKKYFYATELIPDADIYGSGFFIDHDKVVTAAHVLVEAFKYGVAPENLMFIRGRYVYDTDTSTIEVQKNQLYLLDEPATLISEQMRRGKYRGDMAWVRAKPYFKGEAYPFQWNGFAPGLETGMAIYALGHGLGVPMKLSFGGKVQDLSYNSTSAMFTCDMNILPGSSGSPIFDANTHRLLGIVSGLHEIYTNAVPKGSCIELITDMGGEFSGIATHIAPFSSL